METPVIVAELGSGGMAEVFLAIRRGMGGFVKLVVIKRLRTNMMEGDAVAMFHDEARICARLNHPNVVQTHEVSFDGEHYRLEMEYLDGQPLHRITHRAKKMGRVISHGIAVALIQDVLAGLRYAHELRDYDGTPLGIVHRDVSPQNIFVTYDGRVKLVDFGIAKASGQMAVTQLGIVKGKTRYMAPEQATGRPIDARADIFATGVVLWQLLVGRGYWGDADELAIFRRLSSGELPPGPRAMNPDVPEVLDSICARALAYDPDDRYATSEEFIQALDASGFAERGAKERLGEMAAELFAEVRERIRADIEKAAARPVTKEPEAPAPPLARWTDATDSINTETRPAPEPARLGPSERPVSGAVRFPERRSPWSVVFAATAAVLGAAVAVATMKAITTSAAPASQHDETPVVVTVAPPQPVVPSGLVTVVSQPAQPAVAERAPVAPQSRRGGGTGSAAQGKEAQTPPKDEARDKIVGTVVDAGPTPNASSRRTTIVTFHATDDPWPDAGVH